MTISNLITVTITTITTITTIITREFTFDVDVSQLPCGLNGALYFVEMDEDGGASKYPTNKVILRVMVVMITDIFNSR